MKNLMNSKLFLSITTFILGVLISLWLFGGSGSSDSHEGHAHTQEASGTVWTCSMHPSIRDDEPGTCPICAMDLIPVTSAEGAEDNYSMVMSEAAMKLAEIRTTPALFEVPNFNVMAPGSIQPNEETLSVISSHFAGRITGLNVNVTGVEVRRGQTLATVYSEELIIAQSELLEAWKRRDISPALYRAARQKLKFWEITDQQIDRILEDGAVQERLEILAPVSGTVITRNVTLNDYVDRGQKLFEIADLSRLWVVMDVFERDISHIRTGETISFITQSMPGKSFEAQITFIEPILNTSTRTVRVRAEVQNRDGNLRPGMLLAGTIEIPTSDEKIMIPASSVLWTGPRSLVYVRDMEAESPRFEAREVTLGQRSGDFYVIEEGIEAGEMVVFNGAFKIDSEMQLADKFSMMNRQTPEESTHAETEVIQAYDDVPASFRSQLTEVVNAYILGKDALVESNLEGAKTEFANMAEKVRAIGEHSLSGSGHEAWMQSYGILNQHARLLAESNDIEAARTQFRFISDELIQAVKQFGVEGVVYQQFCPMTFNDEGSFWLSTEEQIANPYLPETMLRCGEVIERIE